MLHHPAGFLLIILGAGVLFAAGTAIFERRDLQAEERLVCPFLTSGDTNERTCGMAAGPVETTSGR